MFYSINKRFFYLWILLNQLYSMLFFCTFIPFSSRSAFNKGKKAFFVQITMNEKLTKQTVIDD